MNVAQAKLDAINGALAEGRTVYVRSALKAWKVTPKTAERWKKAGNQMFKVSGESLYMASGSKWVCIDYCQLDADVKGAA